MAQSEPRRSGNLIVIEGPDGVGKSSLLLRMSRHLTESGVSCKALSFPGREEGTLGHLVYDLHHRPEKFSVKHLTAASRQTLHIAAHLDIIERVIIPALNDGVNILLDRFWWSTWVYGSLAGIDQRLLDAMLEIERIQWGPTKPTAVLLLRRHAPIQRNEEPRYWHNLRKQYDELANRERNQYPVLVLNNEGTFDALCSKASELLNICLKLEIATDEASKGNHAQQLTLSLSGGEVNKARKVTTLTHLLPIKPTAAFDTYWRFAAERQKIFFKRLEGSAPPWTQDPIMSTYKFTNAYRASDRVSQYLIRKVIYRQDLPSSVPEVFFRIMLFKFFNKIETWELLERSVGPLVIDSYSFERYDRVLTEATAKGERIYSAAYIMPSAGNAFGHVRKHRNHLALVERMVGDALGPRIADASSMQRVFELLRRYPSLGDFLAYQFSIDINYSEITDFRELDFVVPGPGALDGIRKCFADLGGLNHVEIIKFMSERQDEEFRRLGLRFHSLWGRPLQLIDCQNLFCEVDKYSRVKHPEISGISGRTKIKQKFSAKLAPISYWYPPKWGINEAVESSTLRKPNPTLAPG